MPDELLEDVRSAARRTGLSQQDVMRQSIKAGLPKVIEQYGEPGARPFTRAEAREAFAPDPEWEKLESAMTGGSHPQPEED
jgi:hypothetical protein